MVSAFHVRMDPITWRHWSLVTRVLIMSELIIAMPTSWYCARGSGVAFPVTQRFCAAHCHPRAVPVEILQVKQVVDWAILASYVLSVPMDISDKMMAVSCAQARTWSRRLRSSSAACSYW